METFLTLTPPNSMKTTRIVTFRNLGVSISQAYRALQKLAQLGRKK